MMTHKTVQLTNMLRILYPIWMLMGILSIMYIPTTLIDLSDAASTAQNISDNIILYRLGIVGRLVTQLLYILIPFLLYRLFRNNNSATAMLMLILAVISIPIAMSSESLQVLVSTKLDEPTVVIGYLNMYNHIMNIAMIFWGLWLFPLGRLMYLHVQKTIGLLLYVAGFGYTMGSMFRIITPDFATLNMIFEAMTVGEIVFILYFVIRGIRPKDQADSNIVSTN